MTNKTTEPAALAGIKPVAQIVTASKTIPYPHIERLVDVGALPTGSYLYSAATVERLVQERDKWASLKESVAIAALERDHALEQLAAMTQERDIAKHNEQCTHDANKRMSSQLFASQAREQQLREGLTKVAIAWSSNGRYDFLLVNGILESTSTDDTALRQWGEKLLEGVSGMDCFNDYMRERLRRKADELMENKK